MEPQAKDSKRVGRRTVQRTDLYGDVSATKNNSTISSNSKGGSSGLMQVQDAVPDACHFGGLIMYSREKKMSEGTCWTVLLITMLLLSRYKFHLPLPMCLSHNKWRNIVSKPLKVRSGVPSTGDLKGRRRGLGL